MNKAKDIIEVIKKSKVAILYSLYLFVDMAFTTGYLNTIQYENSYEWRKRIMSREIPYLAYDGLKWVSWG
jgi:hypothetical protein